MSGSVRNQDVRRAKVRGHVRHPALEVGRLAYVHGVKPHAVGQVHGRASADGDAAAFCLQTLGQGATDPLRARRHQGHAARNSQVHGFMLPGR